MRRQETDRSVDPVRALQRRALRLLRRGESRRALQALREATALSPSGATYTRLGHALLEAGKTDEALHAFRQALYCFRYDAMRGRARTVARMILELDPADAAAQRRVA